MGMSSLPNPTRDLTAAAARSGILLATAGAANDPSLAPGQDQQFLLRAFRSFSQAAQSLEHSYGVLHGEVERLRRELEKSNSDLALSLEENRNMRQHLDCILEGLPCGVLVVAEDGTILRANPAANRLLHRAAHSGEISKTVSTLDNSFQELLARSRHHEREEEIRIAGGEDEVLWLTARHASIAGDESVYILRDVSEHRHLEAAQEKLRRARDLAEISTVLAHEIRNPLASLELFAGLLAESRLDAESRASVEHIQAGLRTLAATVNNVLHFHGGPELQCTRLDMGQLLEWARDFFSPLARQSSVVFSLQNDVGGVLLWADRHRLEQVLLNLLLNAVRAMPQGGWVELAGHRNQERNGVILRVADTGPGIPARLLPKLFQPGSTTESDSPGLGLSVCRKIVEQHGGTIAAGTRPGAGAIFTVTLPLAAKTDEAATNAENSDEREQEKAI
jgi:signal transduction histidine kinase